MRHGEERFRHGRDLSGPRYNPPARGRRRRQRARSGWANRPAPPTDVTHWAAAPQFDPVGNRVFARIGAIDAPTRSRIVILGAALALSVSIQAAASGHFQRRSRVENGRWAPQGGRQSSGPGGDPMQVHIFRLNLPRLVGGFSRRFKVLAWIVMTVSDYGVMVLMRSRARC